jgi:hypothetical protein
VPLRALPSSPLVQLIDEELVWIMLDRLGIKHPEAAGIRKCPSCSADMKGGRHALRCKTGGGPIAHHNLMRDTLAAVHSDAGVVVGSETRHLLPGSGEKPADVHAHGIGNQGRDIAIDVAIVDSQTGGTGAELQRRALATGIAARRKEAEKRNKRREAGAPTMEERLLQRGMDCTPIIFEVDGATTGTWARYLKKLSEIAHTRRGHNEQRFMAKWRTRIAMALAKRGAQVAIRRSHAIQCCYTSPNAGWDFSGDDDGPMGAFGVEPRIEMAADSTAHIVFDNTMDMTCM